MDKLKMHSPDLSQENITKIREMFLGCVTEAHDEATGQLRLMVDFDQLRQELSDDVVDGPQERYRLDWPGKRKALALANAPIAKTLRPDREESVNFETTQNLFIEGDNLDGLKLLQEIYLGRVKMIYIDPPYNTGKDVIYKDTFAESRERYLARSHQINRAGERLVTNPDSNGRFHSDWLSMMYPRLRLAKNLLRDDGVMFMSIDDGEVHSLRKVADEIFGPDNFVANIIWEKKYAPSNDAKWFSDNHDHILLYAKNKPLWRPRPLPRTAKQNARYQNRDKDPRGSWMSDNLSVKTYSAAYDYPITTPSGRVVNPPSGQCWRYSKQRLEELIADNRIWFGANVPRVKRFLSEVKDGVVPLTIWKYGEVGHNQIGRQELNRLFDNRAYFDGPKPVSLLERIVYLSDAKEQDVILDFFAGSATTAHAVMQSNAKDGGNRRFIMVQLPEETDEKSEARKAGFETIAGISKERVCRAGKKIIEGECHLDWNRDVGFRVLKVDTSNMKDVFYQPDKLSQLDLPGVVDNVKPDRTSEDLLFQVLVDWGVDLTLPIHRRIVQGKTVFFVDDDALVACFDLGVSEELVKELAGYKPLRVVFRDNGFVSDAVKINVEQIFRQLSPTTEVKAI